MNNQPDSVISELLDSVSDMVLVAETNGRLTYTNKAWRSAVGESANDSEPSLFSAIHAADQAGLRESFDAALRGGGEQSAEARLVTIDGARLEIEGTFKSHRIEDRPCILAVFRNVTRQKQTEEERDQLFDLSLDPMCLARTDGWFFKVNPSFERVLGYTEEELLSRSFFDIIHPEDREPTQREIERLEIGVDTIEFENRNVCKDGSVRWLAWSCPATRRGSDILYAVARDVTERKRAEETASRLAAIVKTSDDAIISVSPEGQIMSWNGGAARMFGYTEDDTIGQHVSMLAPSTRLDELGDIQNKLMRGEEICGFETQRMHQDGHEFYVSLTASPLEDAQHNVTGFSAILRDITQQRKTAAVLRSARETSDRANRAKSEFLAKMSHEIRTPMTGIIGMTNLTLETSLSPDQREYLKIVEQSADMLLTIINEILDFSKIEAGHLELESVNFSLRDCLGDTMNALAGQAHKKGLELVWSVGRDVPDTLVGSPQRLVQILVNVVGNAIKFTLRGEVVLSVETEGQFGSEVDLHFRVRDTGVGIPPDKRRAIFDAFSQVDNGLMDTGSGTGLGLTISARLVELMHGNVWVESEVGQGSTFHFTTIFRVRRDSTSTVFVPPESIVGRSVLIVDDNRSCANVICELLASWKMEPEAVHSATETLAVLERIQSQRRELPLLLVDATMPDGDGFGLVKQIRKRNMPVEVIMMHTTGDRFGGPQHGRELNIKRNLIKPLVPSVLLATIQATFEKHDVPEEPQPTVRRARAKANGRLRVLIVDDHAVNRLLITRLLEQRGHSAVTVENGLAAVQISGEQDFDILLMDVRMPEMDGFAATAAIREREARNNAPHRTPIVALTAHAIKGDRERCLAAGMDAYVAKPINVDELFAAIEELTRTQKSQTDPDSDGRPLDLDQALHTVGGSWEVLVELAELYVADYPITIGLLAAAVRERDADRIAARAHRLKSGIASFYPRSGVKSLAELETAARNHELAEIDELFAWVVREFDEVIPVLERLAAGQ